MTENITKKRGDALIQLKPKFQPYLGYKRSSLEWIEQIPTEWEKRRFKFLFNLTKRPVRDDDEVITAFRDGIVTLRKNRREGGFTVALQESGYQGIRIGDLVIHGMDGFAGAIGVSDSDGKATPAYSVCQPLSKEISAKYYGYLLRALALNGYISILARGIRERSSEFKWNVLGNLRLVVPAANEQRRIEDFLDKKMEIIDELILKKECLVEPMDERRTALITRAVTRGLGQKIKLKPSGVDWLGDVPDGWKIEKLKRIASIDTTGTWGDDPEFCEKPTNVVSTPYITNEGVITGDLPQRCITSKEMSYYSCKPGDILVVKSSGSATNVVTGKAGLITEALSGVCFSNFLLRIRPKSDVHPRYLHYFLNSYNVKDRIRMMVSTTTYPNLKIYEYRSFEVPLPAFNMQKAIADFLDTEIAKIDKSVALIRLQIERLKEYRASLIYSAVTGKIKI